MSQLLKICFWLCLATFLSAAQPQEVVEVKKEEVHKGEETLVVNYSEDQAQPEQQYRSGVGRIFRNPVLASGLASGSAAINRSIESLMETIFYNLLDQKLAYRFADHAQFAVQTQRDVYPAASGGFVVVDRLGLGPEYAKVLREFDGIPVSLGVDGKVNAFDIYYRTDGMRLAESEDLPFWRVAINNWLGILPVISMILPPSFNPNEMYDPLNLLETPFSLPLSVRKFKKMPIGSIRSYNITGGVSLPIDFAAGVLGRGVKDKLEEDYDDVVTQLPYSVFVEGEYRINVLRRSQNIAWVGLTTVKRLGHRIEAKAGQVLKIFEKLSPWWGGLPVKMIPLEANASNAKAQKFNQLYEFDLRNKNARKVYTKTVKGDFDSAHAAYLAAKNKKKNTGVKFHFNRTVDAIESGQNFSPNLAIIGSSRDDRRSKSEIETLDEKGKFWILEAKQETDDESVDALTGKENQRVDHSVEMKVLKRRSKKGDRDYEYVFSSKEKDPYNITLSFYLNDRYVNSHEYRNYLNSIRYFTKLPLRGAPKIPRRDPARVSLRRRHAVFNDPMQNHRLLHVTPTHIGRMSATAVMVFNSAALEKILKRSPDQKWRAFAEAYGLSTREWGRRNLRQSFEKNLYWAGPFITFPLKTV